MKASALQEPCEALFERLAQEDPDELARLVQSADLAPHDLTFAAEVFGRISEPQRVRQVLMPLLRHPSPLVREGAIYGLQQHLDEVVRSLLLKLASGDASPGVREAAAEALLDD